MQRTRVRAGVVATAANKGFVFEILVVHAENFFIDG